ncbi:MAG TPA: tRNA glutamyl-Q(34) synthetase GluQRS [Xanthobacteraceae bacterium]|jgi:glutamyl-Q tRNA(Asp) synthetase|nr:tRNA glutamyl-Q(34) synthetase GluQRS [Xanthobacteraceae bacterium]
MPAPIFRFAPSPNGFLHLGHAFSALLNFDLARLCRGRFLLRIEDIDPTRCRPEYETAIYEDLAWLGLSWETPVRRQSAHFDRYRAALAWLEAEGLLYPAFESRTELAALAAAQAEDWPRDPDGGPLYPGESSTAAERERRIARGDPFVLRLAMDKAMTLALAAGGPLAFTELGRPEPVTAQPAAWGDVVLARKETPASYHLAVVIDDADQGVTHVVRGLDLAPATDIHRLLQNLFQLPAPSYAHHRLILDESGRKLSKSTRATSLRSLRADGVTPDDVRDMVGVKDAVQIFLQAIR